VAVTDDASGSPHTVALEGTGTADVTVISPSGGCDCGGTRVTVIGHGFTAATSVRFGSITAQSFTVDSDTQVTAVSPPATGVVDVTVTTPTTTSATNSADRFTYLPRPSVATLRPSGGCDCGGTTVMVIGKGFTDATGVSFGGIPAQSLAVESDTQITVLSPPGAATVDVTVTTPAGPSASSGADRYTYAPRPSLTALGPNSGCDCGGTRVTVIGNGFTAATAVSFGGAAAKFMVQSATQIIAVSPPGTGAIDVTVTTPAGSSATSGADRFTYFPRPSITNVSPSSGCNWGGSTVTIVGKGFSGATAVSFGGTPAASYSVVSDTQITAVSPSGTGTIDIAVSSPGGTSATSRADQFTFSSCIY
jgi:hypothetical protein